MDFGFCDEMGFADVFDDTTGNTAALCVCSGNGFWKWLHRDNSLRIARIGVVTLTPLAFWLAELGLARCPRITPVDSSSVYACVWQAVHAKRISDAIWDNMIKVSGSIMADTHRWRLPNINIEERPENRSQSERSVPLSFPEERRPDRPGEGELRQLLRDILEPFRVQARRAFSDAK